MRGCCLAFITEAVRRLWVYDLYIYDIIVRAVQCMLRPTSPLLIPAVTCLCSSSHSLLFLQPHRSAVTPAALPSPLLASHLLQPFAAASTRTPLHALATALRSAGAAGARAGDPSVRRLLALASASLASAARRQDLGGVGSSTGVSKYAQRAEERKEAARLASHSELQDLIQASTAQAQAQADGTQGAAAGTKAQAGSKTAAASSPSKGQQARSAAAAVGSKAAEAVAAVGSAVGSAVSSLVGRKGGRTAQDGAAASAGGKKGSAAWDSTEGYTVSKWVGSGLGFDVCECAHAQIFLAAQPLQSTPGSSVHTPQARPARRLPCSARRSRPHPGRGQRGSSCLLLPPDP